jgi:hypothetical protein
MRLDEVSDAIRRLLEKALGKGKQREVRRHARSYGGQLVGLLIAIAVLSVLAVAWYVWRRD